MWLLDVFATDFFFVVSASESEYLDRLVCEIVNYTVQGGSKK